MTRPVTDLPRGKGTVTPYIGVKGAARFLDFLREAFGAEEYARVPNADGTIGHAEVRIGNSTLMLFDTKPQWPDTPSFLSLYVENVDETFARALAAGAETITEVTTSGIVGDRFGRVRDPLGNIWWIVTHLEDVTPEKLSERFDDPDELLTMQYLQQSFDAEMERRSQKP